MNEAWKPADGPVLYGRPDQFERRQMRQKPKQKQEEWKQIQTQRGVEPTGAETVQ